MPTDNPELTVRRFIDAINAHDVEAILGLLTDDHRFTDAGGTLIAGPDLLRRAWHGYFAWFPNYEITAGHIFTDPITGAVAVFGHAGGTYSAGRGTVGDNTWRVPAAWRCTVRDEKIATWEVFCDTEPVLTIMRRAQESEPTRGTGF